MRGFLLVNFCKILFLFFKFLNKNAVNFFIESREIVAKEIQGYTDLRNSFVDWLRTEKNIDAFEIEKAGGAKRAVAIYNKEFNQFLAQQKANGENAYVKNDIQFSSDMFDDLMLDLNADNQTKQIYSAIDTDGNGQVSQEEKDAFFEKIKNVDGNADDITATDVAGAFKQFLDGDMTLLNTAPQAVVPQEAVPAGDPVGDPATPKTPKGDNAKLDTYKAVNLDKVTAENVDALLADASENLKTATEGKDVAVAAEEVAMTKKISAEQGYANADKEAVRADAAFQNANKNFEDAQAVLITKRDELDFANTTLADLNLRFDSLVEPKAPIQPYEIGDRGDDEESYDAMMAYYWEEQAQYLKELEQYEANRADLLKQIEEQTVLVARLEGEYQTACDNYATATEELNNAVQANAQADKYLKAATQALADAGKEYVGASKLANQKVSQFNIAQGQVFVLEEKKEELKA